MLEGGVPEGAVH